MENSFLFQEIQEQPKVITEFLGTQAGAMKKLVEAIKQQKISHVVIAARGTSDNAGRYAKYVLGALNGLTVALATPSLFSIYKTPPKLQGALVLGISQSGKSPDIAAVLEEANKQGCLTAAITNEADSLLANIADHVIDLSAGVERAVAATKTYTAELAAIALLSIKLADDDIRYAELAAIPEKMKITLDLADNIHRLVERYRYMEQSVVIGRGFNYASAFELALKLKELTYTIVEPYSSADFRHGPMAILEPGFPVILIASAGALSGKLAEFQAMLAKMEAEVIAISNDKEILRQAQTKLPLPADIPEWLSPLLAIIPGQIFALSLAYTRGLNVDVPRNLKKVTETF